MGALEKEDMRGTPWDVHIISVERVKSWEEYSWLFFHVSKDDKL